MSRTRNLSKLIVNSDSTLANSNLPSGTVLQVINNKVTGSAQAISSNGRNTLILLNGWSKSITKIKSNSKIVGVVNFHFYNNTAPTSWWILVCRANNVPVVSSDAHGGITSHNPFQYVFQAAAHQTNSASFYDLTNAPIVLFEFYLTTDGPDSTLVVWNFDTLFTFYEIAQ